MSKKWREIIFLVPRLWEEILPHFLEEKGFSGVWLEEEGPPPHRLLLRAYMDEEAWMPALERQIEAYLREVSRSFSSEAGNIELRTRVIEEENWASQWLPFFDPVKIGPVWIRPGARKVDLSGGEQEIVIDPGEAFGTGHHETTRLCMEAVLRLRPLLSDEALVLDLGTGTGVLAMFAARLGFGNILALDSDPVAVNVAVNNVARNGVGHLIRVSRDPFQSINARFSLILANLTAPLLRGLVREFKRHIEKDGWLVLSGILQDEARTLSKLFLAKGWTQVDQADRNDWSCLIFTIKGSAV